MKIAVKYTFIFIYLINSAFIMAQGKTDMDRLLWIVDSWVSAETDSRSYEEWKKTDDNLFEGGSKTVKNGEIIFMESLRIERTSEGIFYVADVKHNPKPVRFKLTEVNDTLAVFENPEHDFPKKITYMNENGNLHAIIEGPGKDGKDKKIDFFMSKMR